jgi:hypothetical protein
MIELPILKHLKLDTPPLAPGWKGARDHIGPVQTVTPLVDRLSGKTTCATVTLMSGVMLWGAARLRSFTEADFCFELADAAFAWQFDWRYVEARAKPYYRAPDEPTGKSAAMTLANFLRDSINGQDPWTSFYQPILPLFHMANVVNFILPDDAKREFERWLAGASDRLDAIARAPELEVPEFADFESEDAYDAYCAPRRGAPLPPIVLDLDVDHSGVDLEAEARSFLASLDPAANRFLRGAAELAKLGFKGAPYGRGA